MAARFGAGCAARFKMVGTISLRNTCDRQIPKGGCGNRWDLVCLPDAARSDIAILAKGGNGWDMPDLKVMQCECQCLEITISLLDKSSDGVIGFVVGLKFHCGFARPQKARLVVRDSREIVTLLVFAKGYCRIFGYVASGFE